MFHLTQCYLPNQTPATLLPLRREELRSLRDRTGEWKEWERAYNYDCYHGLGTPIGGTEQHPYPCQIWTGCSTGTYPRGNL